MSTATLDAPPVVHEARRALDGIFNFGELEEWAARAADRAEAAGRHARIQPDGSFLVCSESDPRAHNVLVADAHGLLFFSCTCDSGVFRNGRLAVHCRHGARTGRSLVRRGKAIEYRGLFYAVHN